MKNTLALNFCLGSFEAMVSFMNTDCDEALSSGLEVPRI